MWPGEFVNAHLVLNVVKNGVTVPAGSVQMGPTGPFVYEIASGSTVKVQAVSVTQVDLGHGANRQGPRSGRPDRGLRADRSIPGRQGRGQRRCPRDDECARARDRAGRRRQHRDHHRTGRDQRDHAAVNISEPFIRRPIATALLMAALLVGGRLHRATICYRSRPLPSTDFPDDQAVSAQPNRAPAPTSMASSGGASRSNANSPTCTGVRRRSPRPAYTGQHQHITLQFDLGSRNIDGRAAERRSKRRRRPARPAKIPFPDQPLAERAHPPP